jgi:hypothetical protein
MLRKERSDSGRKKIRVGERKREKNNIYYTRILPL